MFLFSNVTDNDESSVWNLGVCRSKDKRGLAFWKGLVQGPTQHGEYVAAETVIRVKYTWECLKEIISSMCWPYLQEGWEWLHKIVRRNTSVHSSWSLPILYSPLPSINSLAGKIRQCCSNYTFYCFLYASYEDNHPWYCGDISAVLYSLFPVPYY